MNLNLADLVKAVHVTERILMCRSNVTWVCRHQSVGSG